MNLVRMMGIAAAAAAMLGSTVVLPASAQNQTGGNQTGAPGCNQAAAAGTQNQRGGPGGQSQAGAQTLGGLINVAIQDVQAAAANNNQIQLPANLSVVCLNDVLNGAQVQALNDILNNSPILSNNTTTLTNLLNGNTVLSNIANGARVLAVDLNTGNVYVLR